MLRHISKIVYKPKTFSYTTMKLPDRTIMDFDVIIVGAGPAGLSAALRLKQLDSSLSVVVLEKASQIGGHTLSGAVIEPRALNELIPDWSNLKESEDKCPPLKTRVTKDEMFLLTKSLAIPLPIPSAIHNPTTNYIVSLSEFVRWLGRKAEEAGVEIYPGFAGAELVYDSKNDKVIGIATNDVGINRQGIPKDTFERGLELRAKRAVLLAEGCHGSLSKKAIEKYNLRAGRSHQTYGIGLKEVWELPVGSTKHKEGKVTHALGWPLTSDTYGGSFMYHYSNNLVSIGLVIGLDYSNPFLNPYKEFQRMKLHPLFKSVLEEGKCIAYGARALNEGGWQSIPKLNFPGGGLIGCSAGFVNVPKIKGTHTAMKSGMIAAESLVNEGSLDNYENTLKGSWMGEELYKVRNVRPAFHHFGGILPGIVFAGLDALIFKGKLPFTLSHGNKADHATLRKASEKKAQEIPRYPKPDGKLTFELLESVSRTGTNHEEDQPCHLHLKQPAASVQLFSNLPIYAGPEQRFCPAGVYEYVDVITPEGKTEKKFQINAQNCIHCKTCDIKDPGQNIDWRVPEGGGGPQYTCT